MNYLHGIIASLFLVAIAPSFGTRTLASDDPKAPPPAPAPDTVKGTTNSAWTAPAPTEHPENLGLGIQRTIRLLATSTPEHRNPVRILFYGQSITEQKWSQQVADDLRQRFPNADLEIENRAIGGFASQLLIRPAEHDVYPFYPDLVIFHVYGADQEYEQIIQRIRSRTTAEVLMQRDHVAASGVDPHATPETNKGLWWDNHMNNERLPQIAQKYGCGLVDVRGEWLRYLADNHLQPKDLLIDGVHLNDRGCYVMAQILKQYLIYRPKIASGESGIRDITVGQDVQWNKGRLVLEFTGNRIDLLPASKAGNSSLKVLIDGKAPSAHPECYAITRPQPNPWASPLSLSLVNHDAPLQIEDWTLTVTEVTGTDPKAATWKYDIVGSKTGPDGSGDSTTPFTSASKRVKIEPESFFRGFSPALSAGHKITWHSYLMGTDTYTPATTAVLLAQGLTNTKHRLELIYEGKGKPPALKALRTYKPPYQ